MGLIVMSHLFCLDFIVLGMSANNQICRQFAEISKLKMGPYWVPLFAVCFKAKMHVYIGFYFALRGNLSGEK